MDRILLTLLGAMLITSCVNKEKFTTEVLFDNEWHFVRIDQPLTEEDSLRYISGQIPQEAQEVILPHSSRVEPLIVKEQWQGTCFYFKTLVLEKEDLRKQISLRFDGAMNVANVWVNGKHLKEHLGGYLPFEVELDGEVVVGENSIVVGLDNRDNITTGPVPLSILDYNTYGGLYRHVWLIENEKFKITRSTAGYSDAGVRFRTLNIHDDYANIYVQADVKNISDSESEMLLDIDILDKDGIEIAQCQVDTIVSAGERATVGRVVEVDDVELWSPDTPNLYTLRISVSDGEKLLDRYEKRVGIRTLSVEKEKVYINGAVVELKGCGRHQEYPYIGYAISDKAQWRDAWRIKQAGYNLVRSSNYPPSEAFLEACDAYGIMVIDPIPGWRYFGDKAFEVQALQSAKDMLRRDRNHPSVLAWELSIPGTSMPRSFTEQISSLRDREAPGSYTAGPYKREYDLDINELQSCIPLQTIFDHNRGSSLDLCEEGNYDIFRREKTDYTREGTPCTVKLHCLEDGRHIRETEENKDTRIYYGDLVDGEGKMITEGVYKVRWSVTGDAEIADPERGMVKTAEMWAKGGRSAVVIEVRGNFSIDAKSIDNEQVSE